MSLSGSTRHMLALTVSAFVVLAAEPTYVLVDTAVVGHLGPVPLGALGIGGTLLTLAATIGGFLEYGTTGRAARWYGAGARHKAVEEGAVATVLALALGLVAIVAGESFAGPLARLLGGGSTAVARGAATWLRVAVLGMPGVLVVLAGNGWLRGVQDTRRPVRIVVAANAASALASPLLVYGAGMGLTGSAVANVAAQVIGGALFVRALRQEEVAWRPSAAVVRAQLRAGRDLLVRAAGFQVAFLTAAAVASRMGTAVIAAHQIGYELWSFVALLLDSFAIAAQSLVGAALGGGDRAEARRTAAVVARYGLGAGLATGAVLAAGWWVIPAAFTASAAVRHQTALLWWWLVGMQPAAGVLFALDGVLLGAGDVAFMRTLTIAAALGAFVPLTLVSYAAHWGITGIWAGLTAFVLTRLVGMAARTAGRRWMVTGTAGASEAPAPPT